MSDNGASGADAHGQGPDGRDLDGQDLNEQDQDAASGVDVPPGVGTPDVPPVQAADDEVTAGGVATAAAPGNGAIPDSPDTPVPSGPPEPPEEFVKAAKLAPNHWLYLTDPAWQGEGPPPDWAVAGQWRSDDDGEIVEWQDNEAYRPSPEALGWPAPEDDVDAAIQLATTGYGPAEDVTAALAGAEVAMLVTAGGEPVSASATDGTAVVPVFTSPAYLHVAGRLGFERVRVPELLERLPAEHSLLINSSAPVSMVLTGEGLDDLKAAAAELPAPEAESPRGAAEDGEAAAEESAAEAEESGTGTGAAGTGPGSAAGVPG